MSAKMLPCGESREKGPFNPMYLIGPVISGVWSFLKSPFGKKVFLPVAIIAVVGGGTFYGISLGRAAAIRDFSTNPRVLETSSEPVSDSQDRYGYHRYGSDKQVVECGVDYISSAVTKNGAIAVSETAVYELGFDRDGEGFIFHDNLKVTADQIRFVFDEKLQSPYLLFSDLTRWPTDGKFREFYKADPTAKVTIYCKRSQVPGILCKALNLPSEAPKKEEPCESK